MKRNLLVSVGAMNNEQSESKMFDKTHPKVYTAIFDLFFGYF